MCHVSALCMGSLRPTYPFWYFLLFVSFFFTFLFFMLLLELYRCSSDILLSGRPRNGLAIAYDILLSMVEPRLVNVKNA